MNIINLIGRFHHDFTVKMKGRNIIFCILKIPKNDWNCSGSLLKNTKCVNLSKKKNTKCVRYTDLSQGSKSCKLDIPWHKVLPTGKSNLL